MAAFTGAEGRLERGYFVAATIHSYVITRPNDTWCLRATLATADAYQLTQRPLVFVAVHARGEWKFPILSLDLADGRVVATLGPPLE